MKFKLLKILSGASILFFCTSIFAADNASALLQQGIKDALDKIFDDIQTWALGVLGSFIILQFTWTHIHLLLNGAELEKVWAKFLTSLLWFGMCFYIFLNGPTFIKNTASQIMSKATGVTGSSFDPQSPIDTGISVASQLLETFDSNQSVLGSLNPFPSIMLGLISIVILGVSALLAFKIFMVFIETKMVIALSPLSFSLLGLSAFKDQGLAPLKYLVSMAIRMFLYGAVLSAMVIFSDSLITSFKSLPPSSDPSVWPPIWAAAIGYVLLGAVAIRVDSIAAMLASGSSQMSTGDSAAVGAIAGAAMAAASGSAAIAASKPAMAMADVMKGMAGGGGSVSNASSSGLGASGGGLLTPPEPLSSLGGSGAGGGAPSAPTFETNSSGAPMRPESPSKPAETPANSGAAEAISGGSQSPASVSGSGPSMDDVMKAVTAQKKPSGSDRMDALKQHILREAPAVQIHMNTHQSD